jgi:hypothetical protein
MTWTRSVGADERRRIFDVIASLAWADGRLTADELAAARGAAIALDLLGPADGAVGVLARGPTPLRQIPVERLGPIARHLAFAGAAWVAWLDGSPTPAERSALGELQVRLALGEEVGWTLVRDVARVSVLRASGMSTAEVSAIEIDGVFARACSVALAEGADVSAGAHDDERRGEEPGAAA